MMLLLMGSWWLLHTLYQPQLLPRAVLASVLVLGMLALWWLQPQDDGPWLLLVLPPLLALWLVLTPQLLGSWVLDDAFISFRYAHQWLQGHGLVFNPGDRVEGYTNFLWVLFSALVLAAGADPVLVSQLTTLVLAFALLGLTVLIASRLVSASWAWAAAVLLAMSSSFLLYTSRGSGMETALFTALLLTSVLFLLQQRWLLAGGFTAITLLTRPDAALLALAGGAYALMQGQAQRPYGSGLSTETYWNAALRYTGACLLLYGPYFAWRWSYYGELLPNTFYAKVGSSTAQVARGWHYLLTAGGTDVLLFSGWLALLLGSVLWWRAAAQPRWADMALIGGLIGLFSLYTIAVGGDWMPGFRFGLPILPLLAITTVWALAGAAQSWQQLTQPGSWLWHSGLLATVLVTAGMMLLLVVRLESTSSYQPDSAVLYERSLVARYREAGSWIDEHTAPDTVIVAAAVGALAYYADRHTIDLLGLNDAHIAHQPANTLGQGKAGHEKTDVDYVLAQRPHIIPRFAVPYVWDHPDFRANYRLEKVRGADGWTIKLYVRRDLAPLDEGI
ncbi:MAG: hypothetical protein HC837_17770 [Chloroflexaceae bacterium]|nr:hypothetical protein [Chloroflexaceae bacterium]